MLIGGLCGQGDHRVVSGRPGRAFRCPEGGCCQPVCDERAHACLTATATTPTSQSHGTAAASVNAILLPCMVLTAVALDLPLAHRTETPTNSGSSGDQRALRSGAYRDHTGVPRRRWHLAGADQPCGLVERADHLGPGGRSPPCRWTCRALARRAQPDDGNMVVLATSPPQCLVTP